MIKRPIYKFCARSFSINLGHETCVMGILNCSPDSFSNDGKLNKATLIKQANDFIRQGALILDIGGESTRPGALPITVDEEIKRVIPVIKVLAQKAQVPLSIDSYKYPVIEQALQYGASIVNHVHGVDIDDQTVSLIKKMRAGVILMHSRGSSKTMQEQTVYKDIVKDIIRELMPSIEKCLDFGIKKDKIIIDPGIGFAKTARQNLEIINRLDDFHKIGFPILLGSSRKSFIGKVLNKDVGERLWGTAATIAVGISHGAHIIRVHDVKEMKQVAQMTDAILNPREYK